MKILSSIVASCVLATALLSVSGVASATTPPAPIPGATQSSTHPTTRLTASPRRHHIFLVKQAVRLHLS